MSNLYSRITLLMLQEVCYMVATVATGTLSGLVFYASLVEVNRTSFLPVESTNPFSIFIAWLNLDCGIDFSIETRFYNGMDAYSKTWLQFVFPVYICVLVGLMILVSHFSRRFAKLFGNNQFQSHPLLIYKDPSHIDHHALCHLP